MNNKGINIFFARHEECLCVQSTFYSIIIHYSAVMKRMGERKIYDDDDNNIKPIEVNFNNKEYIIFSRSLCDVHDDDYRTYFS